MLCGRELRAIRALAASAPAAEGVRLSRQHAAVGVAGSAAVVHHADARQLRNEPWKLALTSFTLVI